MNPENANVSSWGMMLKLQFKAMLQKLFTTKWKNRNTKKSCKATLHRGVRKK
jgi:hypothetical protein